MQIEVVFRAEHFSLSLIQCSEKCTSIPLRLVKAISIPIQTMSSPNSVLAADHFVGCSTVYIICLGSHHYRLSKLT